MRKWALVAIIVLFVLGGAFLFAWLPERSVPHAKAPAPTPEVAQTPVAVATPVEPPPVDIPDSEDREDIEAMRQEMLKEMQEDLREMPRLDDDEDRPAPFARPDTKPTPEATPGE